MPPRTDSEPKDQAIDRMIDSQPPMLRRRPDRRDAAGRHAIARRVRLEFHEIPGLCVTLTQAARLFGLSEDICRRVLDEHTTDGSIHKLGHHYLALRNDFVGKLFLEPMNRPRLGGMHHRPTAPKPPDPRNV